MALVARLERELAHGSKPCSGREERAPGRHAGYALRLAVRRRERLAGARAHGAVSAAAPFQRLSCRSKPSASQLERRRLPAGLRPASAAYYCAQSASIGRRIAASLPRHRELRPLAADAKEREQRPLGAGARSARRPRYVVDGCKLQVICLLPLSLLLHEKKFAACRVQKCRRSPGGQLAAAAVLG